MKTLIKSKLIDLGIFTFLISFWNIFDEPNDSHEYEKFEEALSQLYDDLHKNHFPELSWEDIQDTVNEILTEGKNF